ncbi:uncharacterized protein [Halyomorpha halys]|uniref:uncharacterized protein isoform X2 n=1 Tax=Halyomorpha halys TaxID=286706 RepID=UPI0006D5263F|nr:uncharacterized protein LOC106690795 isoform X2 [Halyomorpha halys]
MGNVYDFFKLHQFLGPVAAFLGHLIVILLQNLAYCMKNLDGELYIQGVVTVFLSGAYIYSWSLGNPHLAIPEKNAPFYEVSLMLASGHYAASIFSSTSCYETAYSVIGLMVMSGVLSEDSGANIISTYMFLVEIASFFFQIRDWAVRCNHPCRLLADLFYPIVIVLARIFGLWHLTVMIFLQEMIPFIHKVEILVLTSISTFFATETLYRMGGCQRPLPRSMRQKRRKSKIRPSRRGRSMSCVRINYRRPAFSSYRSSSITSFEFLTSSSRVRC